MPNDKPIVIVVDDDPLILNTIVEMVRAIDKSLEVVGYTDDDVLSDPRIFEASLFVIDIKLAGMDGRDLALSMPQACRSTPFLFMSGYPFEENKLDDFVRFLTVDFISKPFPLEVLANRIKILLAVSGQARRYLFEGETSAEKEFLSYIFLPFVAVGLDQDMKVRYANSKLRCLLGKATSRDLYNRDWIEFIPEDERAQVRENYTSIFDRIEAAKGEYVESVHDILLADGKRRRMKWCNTIFQGAPEQPKMILSVSSLESFDSPLMRRKRSYWQNLLVMHRAAIQEIRRKLRKEKENTGIENQNLCKPGLLDHDTTAMGPRKAF